MLSAVLFSVFVACGTSSSLVKLNASEVISADLANQICFDGFGQVSLEDTDLYARMKTRVMEKLPKDHPDFTESELMTSPFGGGCYDVGGEQTGGIADPRCGCYIWGGSNDNSSLLANSTRVNFDDALVNDWRAMLVSITHNIAGGICSALSLSTDCLSGKIMPDPISQVLLSRYPAFAPELQGLVTQTSTTGKETVIDLDYGISQHRDYGYFAYIAQMNAGGLQVQMRNGTWVTVPQEENTVTFVAGETLEVMTDGYCKAAPHRVLRPSSPRFAVTTFINPSASVTIAHGELCSGSQCQDSAELCSGDDAASHRCGITSSRIPVGPFCWEDYEVFTYCRMFAVLHNDKCKQVMEQYPVPYEQMVFKGRTDCSVTRGNAKAAVNEL